MNPLTKLEQLEQSAKEHTHGGRVLCSGCLAEKKRNQTLINLAPELIALWKAAEACQGVMSMTTLNERLHDLYICVDALERKEG